MRSLRAFPVAQQAALLLLGLGGLLAVASAVPQSGLRRLDPAALQADRRARLGAAEGRFQVLARAVQATADQAAALPAAREALRGDRAALVELFRSLEKPGAQPDAVAAAVHALPFAKVAWARPTADLRGLEGRLGTRRGLHVLEGSVTTILVALSPIDEGGHTLGVATAETALRVERHISNEYLRDFDRIAGDDPGLRVEYVGVTPAAAPPSAESLVLRAPEGHALAVLTAEPRRGDGPTGARSAWWRALAGGLLLAGIAVLAIGGHDLLILTGLAAAARFVVLLLGPPWPVLPSPGGSLHSAGALDAFLTSLLFVLLAASLCQAALRRAPTRPRLVVFGLLSLLSLPLLGFSFALLGRVVADSPWELAAFSLFPRGPAHLAWQASLLLLLATALLLLVAVLSLGGPIPGTARGRLHRSLVFAALGTAAVLFWPRSLVGLPLLPAAILFLAAALLAGTHDRWRPRFAEATPGPRALALVVVAAALSLVLHPTIVHFDEKEQRRHIEGPYAALVRGQAAWRAGQLRDVRREVDALQVLEETTGRMDPRLEELAFSIWSDTRLSGAGIASAVEVQDRSGVIISRFALDLPALLASVPSRALPRDEQWSVTRERLQVGSAERNVLYARRRLSYHGEVHGAVHLYLGDDAWDLPFLPRRDPYTALFRSAPFPGVREEGLELTVFSRPDGVAFTSAERPPTLSPALRSRLRSTPEGLWTTLTVDGRSHHTYLLPVADVVYAMSYPRLSAPRFLAGLAEAVAGLAGAALLVVVMLMLARTLAGQTSLSIPTVVEAIRRRFALRLFVSFAAAAIVPVIAFELAFRGYVADRLRRESEEQALERAAVAQRAVDDFSFYQRTEGQDRATVTNTLLVWVARIIKGDVDVFGQGHLLASSKRELFSSGLLPSTTPGPVFRALTLDGASSVLRAERIGGFSALVAYVPVRLGGLEPGILALPLAVKEQEAQATLEEFDRSMRLASLAFLALAAALALSLSRRIAEPIRDLTRATRRVASGDLEARVSTPGRDELKGLFDSFNQMASDLERQRRDLERSNRLAAWGEMARQVAHEVKNPLTPIQLSAEHLQRVWRDQAPDFGATLQACTDTILRQVRALRGIVTEFSAFARPPVPEPEPADLEGLVREALRPYGNSLPPGVKLSVEPAASLPSLRLDRRLVARAIVNLVENGLHAIGDAGRIAVRLAPSTDGNAVDLTVEDDGPGLSAEARARAFEPFFSTKVNGSGLGLALVKRVIEDHGGSAELVSQPGGPTRVTLRFPIPSSDHSRGRLDLPSE